MESEKNERDGLRIEKIQTIPRGEDKETEGRTPEEILVILHQLQMHKYELELQNDELLKTQTQIKATQMRYFELYDLAPVGYCTLSEKEIIIEVNHAVVALLGTTRRSLVNQPIYRFIFREDKDAYYLLQKKLAETGQRCEGDLRLIKPDDTTIWVHLMITSSRSEDGSPVTFMVLSDITERKQTEKKLQEINELFTMFMAYSPIYAYIKEVTPTESRVLQASENYYQMIGIPGSSMIGKTMQDLFSAELAAKITADDWTVVSSGKVLNVDEELNGRSYTSIKFPIQHHDKILLAGYTIDTTDLKRAELERIKIQKLESLGVFAGGIAHDFNNLLTGIMGNISLISEEKDPEERKKLVEKALVASKRAAGLNRRLLSFAKGGIPETKIGSVSKIIRESSDFVLGKNSPSICELVLPDNLWFAKMDHGQIAQVIQNLVLNASQAMPEGGTIRVSAENVELLPDNVLSLKDGKYVHISVSDTGVGIPENIISKIFDPYFTTKGRKGDGSGLGLAVCCTVIENHYGAITVESKPGAGSTFHVYLPATDEEINKKQASEEITESSSNLKILVMDDQAMIRNILTQMLERLGHKVDLAEHGEEALEKYFAALDSNKPYDLVILDLTIPGGMGGAETLEKMLEINPGIIAIVSSGYSDVIPEGFTASLGKPYTMDQLKSLIAKIF